MKRKSGSKKTRIFMISSLGLILILGLGLSLGFVLKHKNGPVPDPGTPGTTGKPGTSGTPAIPAGPPSVPGIPGTPTTPATPKPKPPSLYPGAKRTLTVTSNFTNMDCSIFYLDYQGNNGINSDVNNFHGSSRGHPAHTDNYIDSTKWSKDQIASQSTKSVIPEIFAYHAGGDGSHIHDWYCNFKFIASGQQGVASDKTIPVDVNLLYLYETTVVNGNTNLVISFYVGDKYVGQRYVPEG